MNKTLVVFIILWMLLAAANCASLFTISPILTIANYAFAAMNAVVFAALIGVIKDYIKKKE